MPECTLAELAKHTGGELRGDGEIVISGAMGLENAQAGQVSFLADTKHLPAAKESKASVLIAASAHEGLEGRNLLLHEHPTLGFARALRFFHPLPKHQEYRHPSAVVDESATVGEQVFLGPHVVIEAGATIADSVRIEAGCHIGRNASVGEGSVLRPQVVLLEECSIGAACLIHSSAIIGSDGFGFAYHEGFHHKIPQVGNVAIGNHCEIGSNVSIDRATTGTTRIGNNVIIDNLVQVAHNCEIGDGSIIVSQVGLSGSTRLGRFVTLAGQVGTTGHLTIGDGVTAAGRAGIDRDIPPGQVVFGYPPVDHMQFKRQVSAVTRLPELLKTVRKLEKRIAELEAAPQSSADEA